MALTGNWLEATILQQFIYWSERVKDFEDFIAEEIRRYEENGLEKPAEFPCDGWIYKSSKQLLEELMLDFSEDHLRRRIIQLVEKGYLFERTNPKLKMDRTLQYRPDILRIQRDMYFKGYALEGYKLIFVPIEGSPSGMDSAASGNISPAAGAIPETTTEKTSCSTSADAPVELDVDIIITGDDPFSESVPGKKVSAWQIPSTDDDLLLRAFKACGRKYWKDRSEKQMWTKVIYPLILTGQCSREWVEFNIDLIGRHNWSFTKFASAVSNTEKKADWEQDNLTGGRPKPIEQELWETLEKDDDTYFVPIVRGTADWSRARKLT